MNKKRVFALLLTFFLLLPNSLFLSAKAAEETSLPVVRVGYQLTPGFQEGGKGEYKSGQGYEYLQK